MAVRLSMVFAILVALVTGAAAQTAAAVTKLNPAAEFLGLWLADFVLARRLRWPQPVPLLAAKISDPAIRRAANARTSHPEDESWGKVVALAYAQATRPSDLTALTVAVDPQEVEALRAEWDAREIPVPLTVVASPFREVTRPVLDYVSRIRRDSPRDVVTVFIPEYVVGHWWENLLHNQSALRLKGRLLYQRGVMVTSVPFQLQSSGSLVRSTARKDDAARAGR